MPAAVDNILIPVDFSFNTEIAVRKAVELAGPDETVIHLLHVTRPGKNTGSQFRQWIAERDLHQWKYRIQQAGSNIHVRVHLFRGASVQQTIIDCIGVLNPNLIIIGKHNKHRRWRLSGGVSPDIVAKRSNCPVLTVKPGSIDNRPRLIVLPIQGFLPERKLEWAVLLARRFKAQVHLLAVGEEAGPKDGMLSQTFLKAYHHLRERLHHPVEYSADTRHNPAKAALSYAELVMADMILVNPQTESGIGGLTGYRHISDLLTRDSKIEVLDVQPYKRETVKP
ncbi:MAG TPA: universal stress protein [Puia sp.]|nr:universal stress protein [Puia sp.]